MKDYHSHVPVDVYGSPFIFENNKMVMQTDLDMNGHKILNDPKRSHIIQGKYDKSKMFTIFQNTFPSSIPPVTVEISKLIFIIELLKLPNNYQL